MSEITEAFAKQYGKIGEFYPPEVYLQNLGIYVSGWLDAQRSGLTPVASDGAISVDGAGASDTRPAPEPVR